MRIAGNEPRKAQTDPRRQGQRGRVVRRGKGIMARQHPTGAGKAEYVTEKSHQMRQPQWMATMPPERLRWPAWPLDSRV